MAARVNDALTLTVRRSYAFGHEDPAHSCAHPRCWLATTESAARRRQGTTEPMDGLSPRVVEKHDLPIQGCMRSWDGRTPPSASAFTA
jgi:hypothetical protein